MTGTTRSRWNRVLDVTSTISAVPVAVYLAIRSVQLDAVAAVLALAAIASFVLLVGYVAGLAARPHRGTVIDLTVHRPVGTVDETTLARLLAARRADERTWS